MGRTPRRSCSASSPTTSARSPRTARSTASSPSPTAASWTTSSRYRLGPDHFLTVTNASNHEKDLAWFEQHAREFDDVTVHDALDDYAMLAVQGPEARDLVAKLADGDLPKRFRTVTTTVAGVDDVLIAGTGYTGEDGVELLVPPQGATAVWDALTEAGAAPIGLGARDTLRLEVCFHLYGNDLSEDRNPIEAGLGWCCKEATQFIGADKIAASPRERHGRSNSSPSPSPARASPARATRSPAAARSRPARSALASTSGSAWPTSRPRRPSPGTPFEIDVRGKPRTAEVREKPLYRKE